MRTRLAGLLAVAIALSPAYFQGIRHPAANPGSQIAVYHDIRRPAANPDGQVDPAVYHDI